MRCVALLSLFCLFSSCWMPSANAGVIEDAQAFIAAGNAGRAAQLLEEDIRERRSVPESDARLQVLSAAYVAYIGQLRQSGLKAAAEVYLRRLEIIDRPAAANLRGESTLGWFRHQDDHSWLFLYNGNQLIGGWYIKGAYYLAKDYLWADEATKRKHRIHSPPHPLPPNAKTPSFGVISSKLSGEEHFSINGEPATLGEVKNRLASLPDDSKKPHLTIVSRDRQLREQAVKAIGPEAAKRWRIQLYDPEDEAARSLLVPFRLDQDRRFNASGFVALLQPPEGADGKARATPIYDPSKLVESLRSIDPQYDPNRNPEPQQGMFPGTIPLAAWPLAAAAGLLFLGLFFKKEVA